MVCTIFGLDPFFPYCKWTKRQIFYKQIKKTQANCKVMLLLDHVSVHLLFGKTLKMCTMAVCIYILFYLFKSEVFKSIFLCVLIFVVCFIFQLFYFFFFFFSYSTSQILINYFVHPPPPFCLF